MRQTILALALLAPMASSAPPETPKPDFSGEWTLNREKSRLQTPMPDSTLFRIEHREPAFRLTRTHVVKGKADTFSIDLTTDGKEVVKSGPDETLHSRAYWEGAKLVFDSRIVRGSREATNVVRYSLSADGRVFTAEEAFRGPKLKYDNVWVFDRVAEPAPGADLTKEVAETERAFAKTMADRDHAAFVTFLAKEAVFFSGEKAFRGADAVAASWKRLYEKPEAPFSWEPEQVEVLDSGTLALSSGPVRDPSGKLIGTFTSIWRREAPGRWRIVFDKGCPACPKAP